MFRKINCLGMFAQRFWVAVLVVVTMVLVATPAWATSLSPVAVTGFNRDVMYGPDGGTGGGLAGELSENWGSGQFFVNGTVDKTGVTQNGGLPVGNFTSAADPTHTYCLAPAGGDDASNNVLSLRNLTSGTLTLQTPGKFDAISLLGAISSYGSGTGSGAMFD